MASHEYNGARKIKEQVFDGKSKLADAAQSIIHQLEDILGSTEKEVVKNSKELTTILTNYVKEHPYMSAGTALAIGGVITYLVSTYSSERVEVEKGFFARHMEKDTRGQVEILLSHIGEEIKTHSVEICDAVLSKYAKNNPVQATGVAILASILLTALARR